MPTSRNTSPATAMPLRAGTRVRVVDVAGYHPYFAGEEGTVWCSDRRGAVVTLDSRGVADTRFTTAELITI